RADQRVAALLLQRRQEHVALLVGGPAEDRDGDNRGAPPLHVRGEAGEGFDRCLGLRDQQGRREQRAHGEYSNGDGPAHGSSSSLGELYTRDEAVLRRSLGLPDNPPRPFQGATPIGQAGPAPEDRPPEPETPPAPA